MQNNNVDKNHGKIVVNNGGAHFALIAIPMIC
jgi:hypothetical protein